MKTLDRYILRELMVPFLIGTLAVVLMFDINLLMALTKDQDISNVPTSALIQVILYKTPFFLNMTLPVGTSLGASLAMSRLARESELTAMRSSGARILRVIAPIAMMGCVIAVGDYLNVEKVMPRAEKKESSLLRQYALLAGLPDLNQNKYIQLDKYQVAIGTAQKTGRDKMNLTSIVIFSRPGNDEIQLIFAKTGHYDYGHWTLDDARIYQWKNDDLTMLHEGKTWEIRDQINVDDLLMPPQATEMTASQLASRIETGKKLKQSTQQLEIEFQTRYSVPASCIIFALVAPALAIMFGKSGFAGVLLSIFLVFLYYNAFVFTTQILGKNTAINPILAAWSPNILFIILGLIAIRRLE